MIENKMADWVSIIGLIIAVIAIALGVGLLIWMIIISGGISSSYTVQIVGGTGTTATSGGGNKIFVSQSTATTNFTLNIAADGSATQGKFFYIVNQGQGPIIAAGPTGNTVVFPATTVAKGASAGYVLTATNQYAKLF